MKKRIDSILGSGLILFCVWAWLETSRWRDSPHAILSVRTYPRFIFTTMAILGLALIIRDHLRLRRNSGERLDISFRWSTLVPVILLISLYALALEPLGFIPSTSMFLITAMFLFGLRSWKQLLFISACGTAFLYAVFVIFLQVQL